MTISYFLTYWGPPEQAEAFRAWFESAPLAAITSVPRVRSIDLFASEPSEDPYLNDGSGPILLVQIDFDSLADLDAALNSEEFGNAIGDPGAIPVDGCSVDHEALETHYYPVAGEDAPSPRTASLSYVVRYHRPAEDEAEFVRHYVANHPPILGKFPDVRNVICNLPVEWSDPLGLRRSDYMLGNEVVFDSVDALNAALASDIRHELRDDFKTFPPFTGRNTHYAMRRRRVHPA